MSEPKNNFDHHAGKAERGVFIGFLRGKQSEADVQLFSFNRNRNNFTTIPAFGKANSPLYEQTFQFSINS